VDAVNDHEANTLMCLEEAGQTSNCHVKLNCVHTLDNVQIGEHLLDESVLVFPDSLFVWVGAETLAEPVLVVNVAHFLIELS